MKSNWFGINETHIKKLNKLCLEGKLPVNVWKSDEAIAMEERGETLRIFDINHKLAPSLA